jgi:hypothetical protein
MICAISIPAPCLCCCAGRGARSKASIRQLLKWAGSKTGARATGVVESLKSQPLALVVINVIFARHSICCERSATAPSRGMH